MRTRWGNEIHQAFDLLRLSESKRLQRDRQAARELRDRARQMFGQDRAVLHVDLVEADLALLDGEVRPARIRAERALEGFRDIKYARGMARALYLLGVQAYMEGRTLEAIEYYAASLGVFPYRGSPAYPDVWSCLEQAVWEMRARGEYNELRKGLCLLHDRAESRTGPFRELNHVATDRTADLMEVLRQLSGDHEETAKKRER